jgi:hypothetical protein
MLYIISIENRDGYSHNMNIEYSGDCMKETIDKMYNLSNVYIEQVSGVLVESYDNIIISKHSGYYVLRDDKNVYVYHKSVIPDSLLSTWVFIPGVNIKLIYRLSIKDHTVLIIPNIPQAPPLPPPLPNIPKYKYKKKKSVAPLHTKSKISCNDIMEKLNQLKKTSINTKPKRSSTLLDQISITDCLKNNPMFQRRRSFIVCEDVEWDD